MPYRRRYRRRRGGFRRRSRRKALSYRFHPPNLRTVVTWVQHETINLAVQTADSTVIRLNDIYDPGLSLHTVNTHQPRLLDQIGALYNHFHVYAVKFDLLMEILWQGGGEIESLHIIHGEKEDATDWSIANRDEELPMTRTIIVPGQIEDSDTNVGSKLWPVKIRKIKRFLRLAQYEHGDYYSTQKEYGSDFISSPDTLLFYVITVATANQSTTTVAVQVHMKVKYYVDFSERKEIAPSTK